jgi:hypothetical protein
MKAAIGVKGADINKAAVTADSGSDDDASDPATAAIQSDYGDAEKANAAAEANATTPADELLQDVSSHFDALKGQVEKGLQERAQKWLGTLGLDPVSLGAMKEQAAQAPVGDYVAMVKGHGYEVVKSWAEQAGISDPEAL